MVIYGNTHLDWEQLATKCAFEWNFLGSRKDTDLVENADVWRKPSVYAVYSAIQLSASMIRTSIRQVKQYVRHYGTSADTPLHDVLDSGGSRRAGEPTVKSINLGYLSTLLVSSKWRDLVGVARRKVSRLERPGPQSPPAQKKKGQRGETSPACHIRAMNMELVSGMERPFRSSSRRSQNWPWMSPHIVTGLETG
jgi:hypothetical protein